MKPVETEKNIYCDYGFVDPITGEMFYIGKGTLDRAYNPVRNDLVNARIASFYPKKHIVSILAKGLSETQALVNERKLITTLGRKDLGKGALLNLTNGGEDPWD